MSRFAQVVSLFSVMVFSSWDSFSQMIPIQSTMKTPYGNVPYTHYVNTGSYTNYYRSYGVPNYKYTFTVVMNDGNKFLIKSNMNFTDSVTSLVYKENGVVKYLTPSQTTSIFRTSDTGGSKVIGIPADSCWFFNVLEGELSGYSQVSEQTTAYITAFQEGENGEILSLTKENLMPIVGGDPKRKKLVEKGKLVQAMKMYNKEIAQPE